VQLRRTVLILTACAFASVDLVQKVFARAEFHHARTPYVAIVMAGLICALVVLVPRVPSTAAAFGAGVACGGALGNLVSLLVWKEGVPDPFVVVGATHGLAFNLADVFAVGGDSLLLSAMILLGMHRRAALRAPV
jgi:lipoprotein signal peptidase